MSRPPGGTVSGSVSSSRPLVPRVQDVASWRNLAEGERAVAARLRHVGSVPDHHQRAHLRVHVAVHAKDTGPGEPHGARLAPGVEPEVERLLLGEREDVVVEGIVVRKGDRRADRHDQQVWGERLVGSGDLRLDGCRRCPAPPWSHTTACPTSSAGRLPLSSSVRRPRTSPARCAVRVAARSAAIATASRTTRRNRAPCCTLAGMSPRLPLAQRAVNETADGDGA